MESIMDEHLSVYQRLSWDIDMRQLVSDFHERVAADPKLAPFFANIDAVSLKAHQVSFLTAALGGPRNYEGRSMEEAHSRLRIRKEEFQAVSDHLMNALTDFAVDAELTGEVVDTLALLEAEIVNVRE